MAPKTRCSENRRRSAHNCMTIGRPIAYPDVAFIAFLCFIPLGCRSSSFSTSHSSLPLPLGLSLPPYLSVIGQVVGTVHELLQRAARPVGALVAGRQLFGRRRASVAHVQRGLPCGAPLHVPPLAEVSRHRVPQKSDVVELPV